MEIKFTKNELRNQQTLLAQLEKYLPTLQLKKALLQGVINEVRQEMVKLEQGLKLSGQQVALITPLLTTKEIMINPLEAIKVRKVNQRWENIAGVEIPYFENVEFEEFSYNLFETPPWIDGMIVHLRQLASLREHIHIVAAQKRALEKEFREVSIRVNLFEKILIPRATENIRKIKVFLGDQQLAEVSRAKVAKGKIEARKEAEKLAKSKKVHNA